MHEASLIRPLLREIERLCAEHPGERLIGITLSVGPLSGVDAEYLRHAFLEAAPGTVAQGAALRVETRDVEVECLRCRRRGAARLPELRCGACDSPDTLPLDGTDLMLKSLVFEPLRSVA